MKKRAIKKGRKIQFNFNNRFLYTFIAIAVIISLGVIVYAYGNTYGDPAIMGHTANEIEGVVASGISYTYYCFNNAIYGTPVCTDAGGSQGYCPTGYQQKSALGSWGCCGSGSGPNCGSGTYFLPPGNDCGTGGEPNIGPPVFKYIQGQAFVCSQ